MKKERELSPWRRGDDGAKRAGKPQTCYRREGEENSGKEPYEGGTRSGEVAVAVSSSTMEQMAMRFQGLAGNMYHEPINDSGWRKMLKRCRFRCRGRPPNGQLQAACTSNAVCVGLWLIAAAKTTSTSALTCLVTEPTIEFLFI